MSKVLLIEDSPEIQRIVTESLRGLDVTLARDLAEARRALVQHRFALVLLDVSLPDGDGFQFFADIQKTKQNQSLSVIFLTGRSDSRDKIMGFSLGAEDYITKPFDPLEFRVRVETRIRKLSVKEREGEIFTLGTLKFDLASQKTLLQGAQGTARLDLTPFEFRLLIFLARNEERVLSRDQIIGELWGNEVHVLDRTIDTHISKLRKKLLGSSHTIRTVYGGGYALSPAPDAEATERPLKKAGRR